MAGSGGTAGASTTGGVGGTSGGTSGTSGTSGASGTSSGRACAVMTATLDQPPTSLYVTVDRSEAMREAWPDVTAALVTLFEDPTLARLAPALKFFPDELSECHPGNCTADACASPLVPYAELVASPAPADDQEALLVAAVSGTQTVADEAPITVAWQGARDVAAAVKGATPQAGSHVLLVTAGEPDTCGGDAAMLASLTALALEEGGIATFVGAPTSVSASAREALDRIALNGGTGTAFLIGPETEGLADLINALMPVRGDIACDILLPQTPDGAAFDLEHVVVTLTLEADPPIDLPRVSSGAACGDAPGWHYDDDRPRPTRIEFCTSTCSTIANARQGRVDVEIPCL
jgi:hypothetical protein